MDLSSPRLAWIPVHRKSKLKVLLCWAGNVEHCLLEDVAPFIVAMAATRTLPDPIQDFVLWSPRPRPAATCQVSNPIRRPFHRVGIPWWLCKPPEIELFRFRASLTSASSVSASGASEWLQNIGYRKRFSCIFTLYWISWDLVKQKYPCVTTSYTVELSLKDGGRGSVEMGRGSRVYGGKKMMEGEGREDGGKTEKWRTGGAVPTCGKGKRSTYR